MWWTLGGALALIGGVFAWRRRRPAEGVFVPEVAARAPHPMRRATDEDSIEVRVLGSAQGAADVDFNLSDDSPTEENLALDVNLFEGHGLSESTDMERADFGFAETTDLDLELTEAAARETNEPGTDVIPPLRRSAGSILESEVLPEEEDYDMSVNMDATKMPQPDEVTGRDLQAVVLDAGEKTQEEETYTVDQESDYEVLEQDYEDELTATQAFNEEIERAARELQSDRDAIEAAAAKAEQRSSDDTSAMPFASVTELDLAESMSAGNDDVVDDETAISGLDDTGIHEPLTFSLDTQAITAELEQPDDDIDYDAVTANLEIKSGKGAG